MTSLRIGLAAVAIGLVASAAGCRPEAQPAPNDETGDYFPMASNGRWLYSVQAAPGRFKIEVTGRGEMPVPAGNAPCS